MHNQNRWAPFSAVIDGNDIITELLNNKNKVDKPVLSDEMIQELEDNILLSYQNHSEILLKYYSDYQIKEIMGTITKLDPINKKIILNNHISLYFENIIDIL